MQDFAPQQAHMHAAPPLVAASSAALAGDFRAWLDKTRAEFDHALTDHLVAVESAMGPHSRLPAAVLYSVRLGGKRVRPVLVIEACRVCGGRTESALAAALAIECIHTFSLIHDDLPAMDDDDMRRGHPTNHKVFGDGLAVLAGDWLVPHAFGLLASNRHNREAIPALLETLANGTKAMVEGQGADLAGEERPTDADLVEYIHQHKTAALIETACRMGALCAGASTDAVVALSHYGRHLGLAFQIVDDMLDTTSSLEKMGKRVGKDAGANKQTYPAAFGLDESRQQAWREVETALRAIDSFGGRANRLRDFARFVVLRDK